MDKTPWIPNKKTTKPDLKRILEIMGVVPPNDYDAKDLRKLVTETHTHFMSLLPASAAEEHTEDTGGASAASVAAVVEPDVVEPEVEPVGSAPAALAVSRKTGGFEVDFDDPPVQEDAAATGSTEPHLLAQLLDAKRKIIEEASELVDLLNELNIAEGDMANQRLMLQFLRECVGMKASTVLRAMNRIELAIRTSQSSASSSSYKGQGKGAALREDADDI